MQSLRKVQDHNKLPSDFPLSSLSHLQAPSDVFAGHQRTPQGFPGGSVGKESSCNAGDKGSILGSGRSPGILAMPRKWQPNPVFLPGKFHGQRSLVGYCPWGCKLSDMSDRAGTLPTNLNLYLLSPMMKEICLNKNQKLFVSILLG